MDLNSIDWNALWKEEPGRSTWSSANSKELWDKRADSFDKRINRVKEGEPRDKDDYISKMLDRIQVTPGDTILDIGCGPGTLSIPLAQKSRSVTGLDISLEMLKRLKTNATKAGVDNIVYVNSSWQEAFENSAVGRHDVVVASRSLMAGDMHYALTRISSMAEKAVYLTFPVVHLPLDFEVYKAIGRNNKKHPPYIYLLNMLYQMGINANVEILYSKVRVQFPSIDEAVKDLQWRTDPFTAVEMPRARVFLERKLTLDKNDAVFTHEGKSQWALIWWFKHN